MNRLVYMSAALWVVLVAATPEVSAQGRGGAMPNRTPPPKPERMARPEHPLDRWAAMPPRQREAALSRLPATKQENLRNRLAKWEGMTPQQKERAREYFSKPADQKQLIRDHAQWVMQQPQERRPLIRKEIQALESLSPEARQAELEAPSFAKRFNEDEREHISKMVTTMEPE